jgi:hemerythrin
MFEGKNKLIGTLPGYNEKKVLIKEGEIFVVKSIDMKKESKGKKEIVRIIRNYCNYCEIHFTILAVYFNVFFYFFL